MRTQQALGFLALLLTTAPLTAEPLPRPDAKSEALPEHAAARFGSLSFRHGANITALAVSSDGKFAASGSEDRTVRLWEADTGKLLRVIRCDVPYPASIAFSPDGKKIATTIDS